MKVSELARQAGVTGETVRHYTREGLLHPRRHPDNGYQLYDRTDLERLRFIQRARTLGFGVAEIRDILDHADQGDSPCPWSVTCWPVGCPRFASESANSRPWPNAWSRPWTPGPRCRTARRTAIACAG